ncbi:MAG: PAS domain-containing protein [Nannocystis sp.]|nr:PAS domain-containing protein [Nannocystis sp.]MBA3548679.1 PAS domain-containing protein [Nannocystis sp.]
MVIDLDDGLRVLGWNQRAEQVFRVAEPEALGRGLDDVAPLVGDATWTGVLAADGTTPSVQALARPGEQLLLETWSQVTRDAEGHPVGATIYGHDVTARVLAERRAALEVKLFNAIINNVDISVWAIDRHGIFLYQDGKAGLDVGLKPHAFVGQSVFELFRDSPDLESLREALAGEPRFVKDAETLGEQW